MKKKERKIMETLTNLINEVNRQGNNQIYYYVSPNVSTLEINCYDGKWAEDKPTSQQSIRIEYNSKWDKIIEIKLLFVVGVYVNQKLNESELFKIINSYKED